MNDIYREPLRAPLKLPKNRLFSTAAKIVYRLMEHGFEAYIVGGAVRDLLMGIIPEDCDITTSALPKEVRRIFRATVPIGIEFGTVLVVIDKKYPIEVTTFRSDGKYLDGRHPSSVKFSTDIREDLKRRDFTINGLIYDLKREEVLDYVGGIADIEARKIRTIGKAIERFEEDRLRMLRAIRFAARLNFELESSVLEAIAELKEKLTSVSPERIRDELFKTLGGPHPARGIQLLRETGLLELIFPSLDGESTKLSIKLLEKLEILRGKKSSKYLKKEPCLELSLLFYPTKEKGRFEGELLALKPAKRVVKRVAELLKYISTLKRFTQLSTADKKRLLRREFVTELLTMGRVLSEAGLMEAREVLEAERCLSEWSEEELNPPRLMSGEDLKRMGYPPGPRYKEILSALETAQLNGELKSREEAERWVKDKFPLFYERGETVVRKRAE